MHHELGANRIRRAVGLSLVGKQLKYGCFTAITRSYVCFPNERLLSFRVQLFTSRDNTIMRSGFRPEL